MHELIINTAVMVLISINSMIHTPQAIVTLDQGAIVFIHTADKSTSVYNLFQPHTGMVHIKTNTLTYTLAPGRYMTIGAQSIITGIEYRDQHNIDSNIIIGSYLISSACMAIAEIRQADDKILDKIIKSACILERPTVNDWLPSSAKVCKP